jgi:hypothetical protein
MTITITREMVALFKSCLRTIWPSVKSSHADEAIAAYYGFRTYAALLAQLPNKATVFHTELSPNALFHRLEALGYRLPPSQLDRVVRLFHAEMLGRSSEQFRRMREQTANDNSP